jgi:hypothetical protein
VIEVWAALVGASCAIGASSVSGMLRRDDEAAKSVVRLTAAVEHIAGEVSLLRAEIKSDRQELYPRLNTLEQRVAVLESRNDPLH